MANKPSIDTKYRAPDTSLELVQELLRVAEINFAHDIQHRCSRGQQNCQVCAVITCCDNQLMNDARRIVQKEKCEEADKEERQEFPEEHVLMYVRPMLEDSVIIDVCGEHLELAAEEDSLDNITVIIDDDMQIQTFKDKISGNRIVGLWHVKVIPYVSPEFDGMDDCTRIRFAVSEASDLEFKERDMFMRGLWREYVGKKIL